MVYGFVRQSGGHVTLYSELGLGTSFGLYSPAVPHEMLTKDVRLAGHQHHALPRGNGETILIVEDNARVRKLSVERILDLSFATLEAENGDRAYEMPKGGVQVDLVVSDLVMPGTLNGYDLAAKIAQEFPDLKVLLASGYASDVITSSMEHDGPLDILHKPYRQSDLAQRLHAMLADTAAGTAMSTILANGPTPRGPRGFGPRPRRAAKHHETAQTGQVLRWGAVREKIVRGCVFQTVQHHNVRIQSIDHVQCASVPKVQTTHQKVTHPVYCGA